MKTIQPVGLLWATLVSALFLSNLCLAQKPQTPTITLVANAEGGSTTIGPNMWVEIDGSGLAPAGDSRSWQMSDFVNDQMPTQLDGVSVTMNGESAYVAYISPTQVNVLMPPAIATGPVQVKITTGGVTSAAFTAQAQQRSPSFFIFGGGAYVVGTHADGSYVGPTSLYPGLTTPAAPGEVVVLYGNGFGPVTPPVVTGSSGQSGNLPTLPAIQIGGINASVQFAGLVSPGLYQFNVVVPASAPNGDNGLSAQNSGLTTQSGVLLTVQDPDLGPQLESLSLSASQTPSGSSVQGAVFLSIPATSAGVTVALSSDSAVASVPSTVAIVPGSTFANFTVSAGAVGVNSAQTATITATYNGISAQAALIVNNPTPTITILVNPATIQAGESATLSWSSTNITSCTASGAWTGGEPASGTLSVSQNVPASDTYNLTCTGPAGSASGSATLTVDPNVLADASALGSLITRDQFGANMSVGFDITAPASQGATLGAIGIGFLRWPGGSPSDWYHWQTNTWSAPPCTPGGSPNANSTFDDFEQTLVAARHFDVAVTLNYGSNPQCNGPADPNEAAQWVAYAKQKGYGVKYWTVGNEVYGTWEIDLHSPGAHEPTTYANNVAAQFYPLIKAQDATAQVGVVVDGGTLNSDNNWDSVVLANAKYDFVEIHYYPENPGSESDSFLLTQAPSKFASLFATVQQELVAAGRPNTPIFLGEYNSPSSSPGKQTMSIVNALFVGMVQGEIMNAGIPLATIEDGFFGECDDSGNDSSTLYGWQNFGSYSLFSGSTTNCAGVTGIPASTPFPIARAFGLSSQFGVPGNHVIGVAVSTVLPNVRAYAAQQRTGYALMLFNLDESNPATITIGVANSAMRSWLGNITTYDKALYDQSQSNIWAAPTITSLGTVTLPLAVTLQPWSMNVVTLQ